ncbi:MAG: SusC/RagA family TonB-linked outer membrane protein, partial [Chitinophagaceae bacterium]
MKAKLCFSLLFCLCALFSWAQTRPVTGRVTSDSTREALGGVTVTLKGARRSVTTNNDGRFSIDAPQNGGTLQFSYVGYNARELSIGNRSNIEVTLTASSSSVLNDVVVIGYQTVRRKDLLASVSSVSARDLKDIPINSAAEALNGRLAGVTATTSEGSPDAQIRIRVRGGMSITQDNSPLYVIDGVQVENGLSTISPQDIQSIDVLKDAAATAIYGARGANGVIIITTKSGRTGRTVISYNGFYGFKKLARKLSVMTPYDFVYYQSERSRGSNTDSSNFVDNFGSWEKLGQYRDVPVVDWQEAVFGQTGHQTTQNVGVSGGSKKITFNFGYTFNKEKAVVINSEYERHLFNAKGDYKITNRIRFGLSGRYFNQNVKGAGVSSEGSNAYNRLRNAVKYRPFLTEGRSIDSSDLLADPNPGNNLGLINPLILAKDEYRRKTTEAFNGTASLTVNITKKLTFRSTFGYDRNQLIDRQFSGPNTGYSTVSGAKLPIVGLDTTDRTTITNSNVLTYSLKGINKKHDLDFLLGEETYDLRTEAHNSLLRYFPADFGPITAFKTLDSGEYFAGYPRMGKARYTSASFFGRVSYSYRDKYLFSANLRYDGSSKFAPGKQYGAFPSASAAWRISKEAFMQNLRFVSDLKLRFGYGKIGNNRIKDYLYMTSYGNDGRYYYGIEGQPVYAYYPVSLPNPDLQWESMVNRNFGVDLSLFKGRINLSVDIYRNTSDKLLLDVDIASTYGYPTQLQNIGRTVNKGYELQLSGTVLQRGSFTWTANFNLAHNSNKVEALAPGQTQKLVNSGWGPSGTPTDYILNIGSPVGAMYGYVTDGFYTVDDFNYDPATHVYTLKDGIANTGAVATVAQPGSIRFKDLNGDKKIDIVNDRTFIGDPTPDFTGGLNQQFTFKNW